jgi:hypothetical protein
MTDPLSEFVKNNREAFDDKEPSQRVWKQIESAIPVAKQVSFWNSLVVWRAAAMAFFCLSLYMLFTKPAKNNHLAQASDFNDVEIFYSRQIEEKVRFISELEATDDSDTFSQDFQKLDAMYQVLLEEMKTKPSEKVKDALVLNLLVRIDLLNQQIKKLEEKRRSGNQTSSS